MVTVTFLGLLALASGIALADWRKGWFAAIAIGVLQDPFRKLIPGTPVVMVLSIMVVYAAILVGGAPRLGSGAASLRQSHPRLYQLFQIFTFFLLIAAINGLMTFGLSQWKAPALGLFIYLAPLPAVVLGYIFVRREEDLLRFFRYYCILTAVALISVPLEYLRFDSPVLGTVALGQDWIRHLTGIQIRILSGIYRSPDIMAWHAAMLCMISLTMVVRTGFPRAWVWMGLCGWGFLSTLLSGRRKMLYMVAVFAVVFLWRYWRKFTVIQLGSLLLAAGMLWFVVDKLTQSESTQVYTKGAVVSRVEVLQRLEGGAWAAVQERGIWGAGLGAATQGARHVVRSQESLGWQEGGAGKLVLELGLPAFLFVVYFAYILARTATRIAFRRDEAGELHLIRIALLGMLAANAASFLVSHQPYTDGVLILMTAFLAGALLATPNLSPAEQPAPAAVLRPAFARTARPAIPSPAQRSTAR